MRLGSPLKCRLAYGVCLWVDVGWDMWQWITAITKNHKRITSKLRFSL